MLSELQVPGEVNDPRRGRLVLIVSGVAPRVAPVVALYTR